MLEKVKKALRISHNALDDELLILIESAKQDLGFAGVVNVDELEPIVFIAICTYCQMHYATTDYDRLKASYDEQKAQLSTATNYTDWGD